MTIAICMSCGDKKFGAYGPCESCGFDPTTAEELALPLIFTDHYLSFDKLDEVGQLIKAGELSAVDPATISSLATLLRSTSIVKVLELARASKKGEDI